MRRLGRALIALALLLGASALPAYAADGDGDGSTASPSQVPRPAVTLTPKPGDPFGGRTPPPGPVFVITPGSSGTALPAPSDPENLPDLTRTPQPGKNGTVVPSDTATDDVSGTPGTPGASTTASPEDLASAPGTSAVDSSSSSATWWVAGGVAALLLAAGAVLVWRIRRRASVEDGDAPLA